MTDAERRAKYKYRSKGKRITIDFYQTEMDLVRWLERQEKKQTYIKDLIREDIERKCKK